MEVKSLRVRNPCLVIELNLLLKLENVFMRKTPRPSYFQDIRDFLQEQTANEHPVPQQCSVELMKKITVVLQEVSWLQDFCNLKIVSSALPFFKKKLNINRSM